MCLFVHFGGLFQQYFYDNLLYLISKAAFEPLFLEILGEIRGRTEKFLLL